MSDICDREWDRLSREVIRAQDGKPSQCLERKFDLELCLRANGKEASDLLSDDVCARRQEPTRVSA